MPFLVKHLIEGKHLPVTIFPDNTVIDALKLMTKHDYSQLPVIVDNHPTSLDIPLGMVTYESIINGMRSLKARLEDLHVRDVMVRAPIVDSEGDLFDLLEQLKLKNAVLITDQGPGLAGIVTSYDSTEYFRNHAEHLMRVEDIETTIKEIILVAYTREDGAIDETRLAEAITRFSNQEGPVNKPKTFDDLTLWQYISLLLNKQTWPIFEPIFQISRDVLRNMLEDIRNTRNELAHFRSEITAEQVEQLRFCSDWLTGRWETYQKIKQEEALRKLLEGSKHSPQPVRQLGEQAINPPAGITKDGTEMETVVQEGLSVIAEEIVPGESRYTPLAGWLSSQPGEKDQVTLRFNEVEEIIGGDLPESARNHRSWWANDTESHPQSRLWLDAGWRTTYISMSEQRVTFVRMMEREKAYIEFFSKLLDDLRSESGFPLNETPPSGTSWVVCQTISSPRFVVGGFNVSFSHGQRFRIELYLDTYNQETTKQIFDRIHARKADIEANLGPLSWERIDNKRASRIALYHSGAITDGEENLAALRAWVVEHMPAFYKTLEPIAAQAIQETLQP